MTASFSNPTTVSGQKWTLSVILWTIVLAIMSAFQLWRGAFVDGVLFTVITLLLIIDTLTGRKIKLLRSPLVAPRWLIAAVVGVLGLMFILATVMPQRDTDFPTISVLLDPFLEWIPGKVIFIGLWLVAGLALLRVWSKR